MNEQFLYFHTAIVIGWQPVFTRQESVQIVLDSFTWVQNNTDFQLHGNSPQHNQRIQQFKSYTASRVC
ncbi:MAG: hypothetical protein HC877_07765 [Thioploca sp.]|nr:hypothetical protein [Thioploca sp.]